MKSLGACFSQEALDEIVFKTKGYPYFLQEWGYQSWNLAENHTIHLGVIKEATKKSLERLDEGFFRVRFDRLTPSEKNTFGLWRILVQVPKDPGVSLTFLV